MKAHRVKRKHRDEFEKTVVMTKDLFLLWIMYMLKGSHEENWMSLECDPNS